MPERYDASGNLIGSTSEKKERYSPSGELIDYETLEKKTGPQLKKGLSTTESLTRDFMNLLPVVTGTLGGMAGGPAGAAGGAGLGAGIRNIGNPDLKDAVADTITESTLGGLMEGAAPFISKGLSKGRNALMEKLIRSFPAAGGEDTAAAIRTGMPMSVGQATDSNLAKIIEHRITPFESRAALAKDQADYGSGLASKLRIKFTGSKDIPNSPLEFHGAGVQQGIKANVEEVGDAVTRAYNRVKFDAKSNKISIPIKVGEEPTGVLDASGKMGTRGVFDSVDIEGPIAYGKTLKFINKIKPEIDKIYETYPAGSPMQTKFARFKNTLDDLANGTGGVPIKDWATLKEFRTDVNRAIGSKLDPTRAEGGLGKLAELLGRDIDDSVAKIWEKNTPGAITRLQEANMLHATEKEIFTPRVLASTFEKRRFGELKDPSGVLRLAQKSPEAAAEMVRALGPSKQRSIKGLFFEDLISKSTKDPSKSLDLLEKPQYRQVFSASDRADLVDFFRTMRRVSPDKSNLGAVSIGMRELGVAVSAGKAGVDFARTGEVDIPQSVASGAIIYLAARNFGEKILLNPKYARTASRLASMPPNSGEATFLRKSLLTLMRGTQVLVELANGDKREGKINSDGKVSLDENE